MALFVMAAAWTGPLLAPALADTPRTMDFQAFVTEDDDNNPQTPEVPVEGIRDITFTILSSVVAPIVAESNRDGPEILRNRYASIRRLTLPAALLAGLGALVVSPAFFEYL